MIIHSGGGGRTSSLPLAIGRLGFGVELLFKARPKEIAEDDDPPSKLLNSNNLSSREAVGGALRSGGALCEREGRCLGLDFQVF